MTIDSDQTQATNELVAFLFSRRETLLNNWRNACESDPALTKIALLSREEFNNLMPAILTILEQQLLGQQPDVDPKVAADTHGLHRWQKAHDLPELLRELNHLSELIFDEIYLFHQLYPQFDSGRILQAQQTVLRLMNETVIGSVAKHNDLQQLEAANRAVSLREALDQMNDLTRQRDDLLRTSSHDLRSSLSLVSGAAGVLSLKNLSEQDRDTFMLLLNRNIGNVQSLLTNLMDLARLESGQEPIQVSEFDAGQLLSELVANAQPLATQRGLILRGDGPATLRIQSDQTKVYRIAQNLLVNALNYTPSVSGQINLISVSWTTENDWRWGFSVQDSGPGLPPGLLDILHNELRPTVGQTSTLSAEEARPTVVKPNKEQQIPADLSEAASLTPPANKGEGVGLQIVKRLCEAIGASLEIESIPDRGTLFRVRMPIHAKY